MMRILSGLSESVKNLEPGGPGAAQVPNIQSEDMDLPPILRPGVRKCKNIKSRKNPDVQCPFSASHGDYCLRHSKNPTSFTRPASPRIATRSQHAAARILMRFWRLHAPLRRYRSQGPAANDLSIAVNETELYSLEPIQTIPKIYLFSFADSKKSIWVFDIRTLTYSLAKATPQQNPYNRETLGVTTMAKLHARIAWLRSRKYQIIYTNTEVLTPEQIWNQHVLDYFLKIEALGYYVSSDWFHEMRLEQHAAFYERLRTLWDWRLGLSPEEKAAIVPGHGGLFRIVAKDYLFKSLRWWQTSSIWLIEQFVTGSDIREKQALGALYVLMALTAVSPAAAAALPWVADA